MTAQRLSGRRALVTGGARGLGRAIVAGLAAAGCDVAIHYRSSRQEAQAFADELGSEVRACALQADVTDADECRNLVDEAVDALGGLDILVNNAGIARGGPLLSNDAAGMRATIETNLLGTMFCTAAALPTMLAQRYGRVVAMASPVASVGGLQGQCAYAASKAGIVAFAKTLASEMTERIGDFTSNVVSPGVIPTDLAAFGLREFGEQLQAAIPSGRFGSPDDVASAVVFLVSPEGAYVNGHDLVVDGGYHLKYLSRRPAGRRRT
jgi:3-oxoacyl-[acyl-carrier protein] reductase